jgi:hypothetical protein
MYVAKFQTHLEYIECPNVHTRLLLYHMEFIMPTVMLSNLMMQGTGRSVPQFTLAKKKTAQFPKETNPLTFHGSNLKNHSPNHQRHTFGNHLIHIAPFLASDHGPTGPANDPQCLQQGKYTSPPSASTCLLATPCPHFTTWNHASTNFP